MKRLPGLSVFFPAYNDAASLPSLIARAQKAARSVSNNIEILVINDGSTDDTAAVLTTLSRTYPELRVITHATNRGYGAALISGFRTAKTDWIFYTDGDGQYDPGELPKLVRAAATDTDVVNGYKVTRSDPWYRTIIGDIYNRALRTAFRMPVRDVDCDFRLIRRSKLAPVTLRSRSGGICAELITKLAKRNAVFCEIPVNHYPRKHGTSRFFSVRGLAATAYDLIMLATDAS